MSTTTPVRNTALLSDIQSTAERKLKDLSLKRAQVNEIQVRMMSLHFNALNQQINSLHNEKTMDVLSAERMKAQQILEQKLSSPKAHRPSASTSTEQNHTTQPTASPRQSPRTPHNLLTVDVSSTDHITTIHSPSHSTVHHIDDVPLSPQLQKTLTAMQASQDTDMAMKLARRASVMTNLNNELINKATEKANKNTEIKNHMENSKAKINSLKDELKAKSDAISQKHNVQHSIIQHVHERQQSHSFKILLNDIQADNISKLKSTMQKSEQLCDAAMLAKLEFRATTGRKGSFSHTTNTVG